MTYADARLGEIRNGHKCIKASKAATGQASNSTTPRNGLNNSGLSGKPKTDNGGFLKPRKMSSGGSGHFQHKSVIGSIDCY
jgi:hypothetical protein